MHAMFGVLRFLMNDVFMLKPYLSPYCSSTVGLDVRYGNCSKKTCPQNGGAQRHTQVTPSHIRQAEGEAQKDQGPCLLTPESRVNCECGNPPLEGRMCCKLRRQRAGGATRMTEPTALYTNYCVSAHRAWNFPQRTHIHILCQLFEPRTKG
jgi:hypothetical protein